MRTVRIGDGEYVGPSGPRRVRLRFGDPIDHDAPALEAVVADVSNVEALTSRTWSSRQVFPIARAYRQTHATLNRSRFIECEEHRIVARVVMRPDESGLAPADGEAAGFWHVPHQGRAGGHTARSGGSLGIERRDQKKRAEYTHGRRRQLPEPTYANRSHHPPIFVAKADADKLPPHAESDCRKDSADDDYGLAAAAELVHRKPGDQVVPRRDGARALPRAVCRRLVGVSARAGGGRPRHRDRRRLPV